MNDREDNTPCCAHPRRMSRFSPPFAVTCFALALCDEEPRVPHFSRLLREVGVTGLPHAICRECVFLCELCHERLFSGSLRMFSASSAIKSTGAPVLAFAARTGSHRV